MAEQKTVWVVTQIEEYELENQWSYENEEDAQAKERELHKKLFEDAFEESREQFAEEDDFMDYQKSTVWWDDDCRSVVHCDESVLEGSYDGN